MGQRKQPSAEQTTTQNYDEIYTVSQLLSGDTRRGGVVTSTPAWEPVPLLPPPQPEADCWTGLWLPEATAWKPPAAASAAMLDSYQDRPPPLFTVQSVSWPAREGASTEPSLPAFYRNEPVVEISHRGGGRGGGGGGRGGGGRDGHLRRSGSHLSSPRSPYSRKRLKRA
jgi:hypothetical protein